MIDIKAEIFKLIPEEKLEYCFCGSMKKYEDCCKNEKQPSWFDDEGYAKAVKDYIAIYEKTGKIIIGPLKKALRENICVEIGCKQKAIGTHLFSENKIKREFGNHVGGFIQNYKGRFVPKKKGCNEVKTMLRCEKHDNDLFEFIDNNDYNISWDDDKKRTYFFDWNYRTVGGYIKELSIRQKIVLLAICVQDEEVMDYVIKNYFEYNSTCKLFYSMMDLQQKNMISGFSFKYGEITGVNGFVLGSIFFPKIELENGKKINTIDSEIIEPIIFNTYKNKGKLCYTMSCGPSAPTELWDYMDNMTKEKDLGKFENFINGLLGDGNKINL